MARSRFSGDQVRVVFGQSVLYHRAVMVDDERIVVEAEHGEVPEVGDELQVITLDGEVIRGHVQNWRREFTEKGTLVTITASRPQRVRTYDPHAVEMVWAPRVGDPIRFSGFMETPMAIDEVDAYEYAIMTDADVEGEWPTLAEVGRPDPWR